MYEMLIVCVVFLSISVVMLIGKVIEHNSFVDSLDGSSLRSPWSVGLTIMVTILVGISLAMAALALSDMHGKRHSGQAECS